MSGAPRAVEDVVGRATRAFWREIARQASSTAPARGSMGQGAGALAGSAQDAFWASVAACFPGAFGDLAPPDAMPMTRAAQHAVETWQVSGDAIEPDAAGWDLHAYVIDFELAAEAAVTAWVDANLGIRRSTVALIGNQLVKRSHTQS